MRQYSFDIGIWHSDDIFAPIRNKKDCIELLMKTLKIMITNQEVSEENKYGEIKLIVAKMSRLFYFSENKYFSINFPFTVADADDGLVFSSENTLDIDSKITSQVLGIISTSNSFNSNCLYDFLDPISSIVDSNSNFWSFLKELLLFEDGYIRYEYDEENENGLIHPLNHYDVFYSSNSTFKVGLKNKIGHTSLIDLLQVESNCHFFE